MTPLSLDFYSFDYPIFQVIGNGSFGVVYQAKLCETGEMVAIKKVLQVSFVLWPVVTFKEPFFS